MPTNTTPENHSANRPPLGTPRPVDVHVGARLRQRRTLVGMSQEKLGEAVGLTFQQIQKYERGANRIGASRLYQLACVLDVPTDYFFDDMPGEVQQTRGDYAASPERTEAISQRLAHDVLASRKTLELARSFHAITDPKLQDRAFDLIKALGQAAAATTDASV